ncbi:MAG: hypothetical protein R3183_08560, partial [Oleiphilaceae bacterium]|nr:hypothetical protein [Oleiphilaceae bacterium]
RDQMARAIAADDDFCDYTNRNFVVSKGPDENNIEEQLFVEFSLSYSPFTRIVQQAVLATRTQEALLSSQERATAPFVGFWQASPESFTAEGYTPPILRQAIMNNTDETEIFNLDDGFDTRLGVMEFIIKDQVCYPNDDAEKPGDLQACDDGVQTRSVQKNECTGDPEDDADEGETNKIAYNSFNVNSSNDDVKRVRVETDYVAQQVRIYFSPYIEAIENPHKEDGEPDVIYDPTDCEKQAVFDELVEANGGDRTGISLPVVGDTNYDITFTGDDDNLQEVEPTPAIVYQGQLLTERQTEL